MFEIYRASYQQDFPTIFAFAQKMISESVYKHALPSKEAVAAMMQFDPSAFFIAKEIEKPETKVGFIGMQIAPFWFSEIKCASDVGFYVLEPFRGGKVAMQLLDKAKDWVREQGIETMMVCQTVGNKVDSLRHFYERAGFTVCGFNTIQYLEDLEERG